MIANRSCHIKRVFGFFCFLLFFFKKRGVSLYLTCLLPSCGEKTASDSSGLLDYRWQKTVFNQVLLPSKRTVDLVAKKYRIMM